jgi:hypothetical protein
MAVAHAQRIGYAIDVVKPGGDKSNLQDATVIETGVAQLYVIAGYALRGIFSDFDSKFQHNFVLFAYRSGAKVQS